MMALVKWPDSRLPEARMKVPIQWQLEVHQEVVD